MVLDYKEIGKRIAKRRRELGLKQYKVCEMIDVNYKYISNIETGRSAPSLEVIMRLCEVLQTTPDYFLLGIENDNGEVSDIELYRKIINLSGQKRRLLNGFLDLLNEKYSDE